MSRPFPYSEREIVLALHCPDLHFQIASEGRCHDDGIAWCRQTLQEVLRVRAQYRGAPRPNAKAENGLLPAGVGWRKPKPGETPIEYIVRHLFAALDEMRRRAGLRRLHSLDEVRGRHPRIGYSETRADMIALADMDDAAAKERLDETKPARHATWQDLYGAAFAALTKDENFS